MARKKLSASPKLELKTKGTAELEKSVANDMDSPDQPLSVLGLSQIKTDPEAEIMEQEAQTETSKFSRTPFFRWVFPEEERLLFAGSTSVNDPSALL